MSIAEKLQTIAENEQKVFDAGYEKGKAEGSSEEFVGVKYSDFTTVVGSGKFPKVADVRSLGSLIANYGNAKKSVMSYAFYNPSIYLSESFFLHLEEVYLPNSITGLTNTFWNCIRLSTIHGDLTEITTINGAFRGCEALTEIPYMPNLDVVQQYSFYGCKGLTSVNLYKNPTTLNATAFGNCTNLTNLYVAWAEGEVAGAPWGATNATIHYNTQFDENHNPIVSEV